MLTITWTRARLTCRKQGRQGKAKPARQAYHARILHTRGEDNISALGLALQEGARETRREGGMYGLQPASQPEPAGATRGFTRLWLWVCRRQAEGKGTTQIGISLDKARGADAKPRIT